MGKGRVFTDSLSCGGGLERHLNMTLSCCSLAMEWKAQV